MYNIFAKMILSINLHALKHFMCYVFLLVKRCPYFEMYNIFIILDTFIQKIHNYFKIPYHLMSRKNCHFDYLPISYWFDTNMSSKIKLHETKRGTIFSYYKEMAKTPSSLNKILLYFV